MALPVSMFHEDSSVDTTLLSQISQVFHGNGMKQDLILFRHTDIIAGNREV